MNKTPFLKEKFHYDGTYLVYGTGMYSTDRRFVARFKYDKRDKASFVKFLIANFTVEEYFTRLRLNNEAPATVLESKGWISGSAKKLLKLWDLPATADGRRRYRDTADGRRRYRDMVLANAN